VKITANRTGRMNGDVNVLGLR